MTDKLLEAAKAIISNWDDGFVVHGDEPLADDLRDAIAAAQAEHATWTRPIHPQPKSLSQKMADAGYARRPSRRSLPDDE